MFMTLIAPHLQLRPHGPGVAHELGRFTGGKKLAPVLAPCLDAEHALARLHDIYFQLPRMRRMTGNAHDFV